MRIGRCHSMLIGCLTIALLAPVAAVADDDDDNDVACPCWTAREARKAIKVAFASPDFTEHSCSFEDFEFDGSGQGISASFFLSRLDSSGRLVASGFVRASGEEFNFCQVVDLGLEPVVIEDLTQEEVRECVRILTEICAGRILNDDDDDDDD